MIAGIYNNIQIDASGKVIASGNQDYALSQESGQISYFTITGGTLILIAGISDGNTNFLPINPITALTLDNNFDNGGANDGTIRYIGDRTSTFFISATVSYEPFTAKDKFVFALAKNGVLVETSKVVSTVAVLSDLNTVPIVSLVELTVNDTITLMVSNCTSVDNLTVFGLNINIHG